MKKKVITSAILTIALALSLLLGATYALFTSVSRNSIDITSGKVSVEAVVDEASIQTKQLDEAYVTGLQHTFGGDVEFDENQVVLNKLVPGDGVKFTVQLTNKSNIAVKYRVSISSVAPEGVERDDSLLLFSGLSFKVNESDFSGIISYKSNWQDLAVTDELENITFEIELPENAGNKYQDLSTSIVLVVEAIQGNAEVTGDEEIIRYNGSAVLNQGGIKLDIPEGIFAPGQVPTVEITKPAAPTNFVVKQDATSPVLVQTLDIKLPGIAEDNEELITVTIPVDKDMPGAVVYYSDGTQLEPMATTSFEIDGKYYIQFTTTHFSEYILFDRPIEARVVSDTLEVYFNAEEALRSATSGDIVYLEKNMTLSEAFVIDKAITLDLGSFALNGDVKLAENVKARMVVRSQTELDKAIVLGFKDIVIGQGLSTTLSVTGSGFTFSSLEEVVFNAAIRMLTINGSNNTIDGLMAKTTLPDSQRFAGEYAIMINGSNNTVKNSVLSMGGTATWGATIYVTGTTADSVTTFSNIRLNEITSASAFRGLLFNGYEGTVIVEDSLITSSAYTINIDGDSSTGKLIVNRTTLKGWTSYSKGYQVEFNDSRFEKGGYHFIAAYSNTTFDNTEFVEDLGFSVRADDIKFVFNNSRYNGESITFENYQDLLPFQDTKYMQSLTVFVDEPTTGYVVDESNKEIRVYDADGLRDALALQMGGLYSGYTIKQMDDIDLNAPIVIG
ncbi:hypothetical protein IY230_01640 [Acholeplasma laidlawii]|uniref:hypothetical protein n=1 Tax=Acholeplasma laidlawii TaxID=2148 RepID=UPI0018C2959A|nr:hypothetical protein [Acholeplasma laidlawii]MBG0762312.1 hypothetical protein [Acholeplasma laidlawii]